MAGHHRAGSTDPRKRYPAFGAFQFAGTGGQDHAPGVHPSRSPAAGPGPVTVRKPAGPCLSRRGDREPVSQLGPLVSTYLPPRARGTVADYPISLNVSPNGNPADDLSGRWEMASGPGSRTCHDPGPLKAAAGGHKYGLVRVFSLGARSRESTQLSGTWIGGAGQLPGPYSPARTRPTNACHTRSGTRTTGCPGSLCLESRIATRPYRIAATSMQLPFAKLKELFRQAPFTLCPFANSALVNVVRPDAVRGRGHHRSSGCRRRRQGYRRTSQNRPGCAERQEGGDDDRAPDPHGVLLFLP